MSLWMDSIRRANSNLIKKEDAFFPYTVDECYKNMNYYSLIDGSIIFLGNSYMTKKITWFFQDNTHSILSFSKEMCNILEKIRGFIKIDSIENKPIWLNGLSEKTNLDFFGIFISNGKEIKSATPDDCTIIIKDDNIYDNHYKIIKV